MRFQPISTKLRTSLEAIEIQLCTLMETVPVIYVGNRGRAVNIIAPDYHWGDLSPGQQAKQLKLNREFGSWMELLSIVLRSAPDSLRKQIDSAEKGLRRWIEFQSNWLLDSTSGPNIEKMRKDIQNFHKILDVLDASGDGPVLTIPDTNFLLEHQDPIEYRQIAGPEFTFVLLPTVLAELDDLKINHRNPDIRELAKKAIRRVKGWRNQGPLNDGITVDGSITVRALPQEPAMDQTLSWLDGLVRDDRIIASVLEIQAANPSSAVVLVTGDINMQNKADAAAVTVAEF